MAEIKGVALRRHPVALGAALGSLLATAGRDLPQTDLMGLSGHAFRLTLDAVLAPNSAAELNFHEVFPLWENIGAWFKRAVASPEDEHFAERRAEVLARIHESVDRGMPVIAYDLLDQPDYGLVVGYTDDGLVCLTQNNPDEPMWMSALGWPPVETRSWSRAEAITLLDIAPQFDRRRAEVASLRFAVEHFWAPPSRDRWLQHGHKAYNLWIVVLDSSLPLHGPDPAGGHSYNLLLLRQARADAAAYLAQLAVNYPEAPALKEAAQRYRELAAILAESAEILPYPAQGAISPDQRQALVRILRRALAAEQSGIDAIEKAMRALR